MVAKKWCIGQPRFYKSGKVDSDGSEVFLHDDDYVGDLPMHTIVTVPENQRKFTDDEGTSWAEVSYTFPSGEEILGWVKDGLLEDVIENFTNAEVNIPHPTKDPTDAAQYMVWEGDVKRNMCGELCIAFIVGDDIETLLTKWKENDKLNYYISLVAKGKDNALWASHLIAILEVYGYREVSKDLIFSAGGCIKYKDGLQDPTRSFLISPGRLKEMLKTHYLIAHVRQTGSGNFVESGGFGHWIVVDKIEPYGVGRGKIEIYNPYYNKREEHSYVEFRKSCGNSGYWVNRTPPA
jgi:hypothetical protein